MIGRIKAVWTSVNVGEQVYTRLENRYTSHLCHQRLDPMIEAPTSEEAFHVLECEDRHLPQA
jgi:hypothetical protein